MSGIERESECGAGVGVRGTVVRTVVFALASFTVWWCWSSAASASASVDEVPPSEGPAGQVEPVLFPVVVQPLVEAATPLVAGPAGNSVLPVVDAVTTPAAPVLQSVVPVADQIVGPVVAPAAGPAIEVVEPVVEQVATSTAPVVGHVAPAVAPVVEPVTRLMAPAVRDVVASVADPLAGVTRPALRSVLEAAPRGVGFRPSTAVVPVDRGPEVMPAGRAAVAMPAPAPARVPVPEEAAAGTATSGVAAGDGGADGAVEVVPVVPAPAAVPAAAPVPAGPVMPFRAALPPAGAGAVVGSSGGSDGGVRGQRLVGVLPSGGGLSAPRVAALGQGLVDAVLARFGGRAPVTPD